MKKLIIAFLGFLLPVAALASSEVHLDKADVDLNNKASMQHGAKIFVNYCMGCHSLKYMSYQRMADDLGLPYDLVMENLMFTGKKIGDYMEIAMPEEESKKWFGTAPPDLTLVARSRGPDWLYTYLRGFYLDDSRPYGVNNTVFKDVGMPHVLWELEGYKKPVYKDVQDEHGKMHTKIVGFEQVVEGKLSPEKYDQAVRDLVNFLVYAGEPAKLVRYHIGVWVILFLVVFFVIAYRLKKEYWKDVH